MKKMAEKNYSKRELDTYFKGLTEHLVSQDRILERIEVQTNKTNGRVTKLEYWKNTILWVFGLFVALATPIVTYLSLFRK